VRERKKKRPETNNLLKLRSQKREGGYTREQAQPPSRLGLNTSEHRRRRSQSLKKGELFLGRA